MGKAKDVVSNLAQMLDSGVEEAKSLVETMHRLQDCLEEKTKSIIQESLDRLLSRVRMEADNLIGGSARVLISPEERVTVRITYSDEDPWLKRLKAQDFYILTLGGFSHFIKSLKSEVAEGNWVLAIEFLRANAKIEKPFTYPSASPAREVEQLREVSTSSGWKPSDFLPAPPPRPPLPRGLFKD
ncbi:MAG: hypothetical protein Q7J06_02830 [Bacteroidales bacterium]|nr:hypothetical protein [Bacteroidales bacterium]